MVILGPMSLLVWGGDRIPLEDGAYLRQHVIDVSRRDEP